MRLDPWFDAFYVLSALWGSPTGPQVCPARPHVRLPTASGAASVPPAAPAGVTAFVDVNVVPMDTERVLAHQTVLVEGGRITALGPANKVKVPAGAVHVDGRGQYLMPGLADMHIHRPQDLYSFPPGDSGRNARRPSNEEVDKISNGFKRVAMGITSVRALAGRPDLSLAQLQWVREQLRTAELPMPRSYLPRTIKSSVLPGGVLGPPATPPESLIAYITAAKAAGYDHINVDIPTHSREEEIYLDSVAVVARRVGLPLSEHAHYHSPKGLQAIGSAGGSIEHTSVLIKGLGFDEGGRQEMSVAKIPELIAKVRGTGLWLNPSLDCQESVQNGGPIRGRRELVSALHEAGVKFLLAGDESTPHRELGALVRRAGLSPYEALLTGTRNVAEYFRVLDRAGTVAVGKRADLVLLYGNPLANIGYVVEPAGVMVDGRWLDREALDQGLFTVAELAQRAFGQRPWHPWQPILNALWSAHGLVGSLAKEQYEYRQQWETRLTTVSALGDSLQAVPSIDRLAYDRLLQRMAAELGAMRPIVTLTPEQQARLDLPLDPLMSFDAGVRMWLREQKRLGYVVTVAGVRPAA